MSRHARPPAEKPPRSATLYVSAVAGAVVAFTALGAVQLATAGPGRSPATRPTGKLDDAVEPASGPPQWRTESTPTLSAPTASVAPGWPSVATPADVLPSPTVEPEPSRTPGVLKGTGDALKQSLKDLVPGIEKLPRWARPIVGKAQEKAVPGTEVQACLNRSGALVVWVTMDVPPTGDRARVVRHGGESLPETVDVRLVVQDPSKATPDKPTSITVTVTDPETAAVTTAHVEVTDPGTAVTVSEEAVTDTVKAATEEAPVSLTT